MQMKSFKSKGFRVFDIDGEIRTGKLTPELEKAYIEMNFKKIFKLTSKIEG